jgi:hypothetical protein
MKCPATCWTSISQEHRAQTGNPVQRPDILNQAFRLEQDYNSDARIESGADGNQVIRSFAAGSTLPLALTSTLTVKH